MSTYEIIIVGAGAAGALATYRIAQKYPNIKIAVVEIGKGPAKRRRQLEGWLGILPNGDGKLYQNDLDKLSNLTGARQVKMAAKWLTSIFKEVSPFKIKKDKALSASIEKKLNKAGYSSQSDDFIQLIPKEIHALSKIMSNELDEAKNITFYFDTEVLSITKQKGLFVIQTEDQEFKCKKVILATGRSGWRWTQDLYSSFGIVEENNISKFGIRVELPTSSMKDFNKSNCTITKDDGTLEIGPLSWNGTMVPEDHVDFAIASFRSNQERWESDKVSFNFIGNIEVEDGVANTDRIAKLLFLLSNDRVIKEKVSSIISGKSTLCMMKEYNWIKKEIEELSKIIPDLTTKAYFYIPTIIPIPGKINIGSNLETEVDGMFVCGENTGIIGLYAAMCSGVIAADMACK